SRLSNSSAAKSALSFAGSFKASSRTESACAMVMVSLPRRAAGALPRIPCAAMPPLADSPYRPASRRRAIGEALFAVVVWGATFVATKRALVDASPAFVVAIRSGLGALVLAGVAAWRGEMARVPLRLLGKLAFLGFLGIGFHQWLQAQALMTSDASTAAWLVTVSPIFTALLGRAMLGERLGWIGMAGIGVAAFGVL